jgi:DNA-binding Xre family transcriptional regulator
MTTTALSTLGPHRSVFASADICREAGLTVPDGTPRPVFEDDLWDFTAVVGLLNQMAKVSRRFDFTAITNVRWRLVAKEQIMAMLAPRHEAVMPLPRAYRTPLHLLTAFGRLAELTRFLNWLTTQGLTNLGDIGTDSREAYLAHRRYLLDDNGQVVGERSPATRRAAAQTVVDLVNHRELFSLDRVPEDLRPWKGAAPSVIAEMPRGVGQNKTAPVADSVLQPMLAAARYLVDTLGPHAIDLIKQVRDADRRWSHTRGDHILTSTLPTEELTRLLADYERRREPLPLAAEHTIRDRLAAGCAPRWPGRFPPTPREGEMNKRVGYHWHLRRLMADRGMFATTDLVPLLAERGVSLSREQVYRLVVGVPERLNLAALAALCDILDCSPAELVEPYVDAPASARGGSAGMAPPARPRRARVAP